MPHIEVSEVALQGKYFYKSILVRMMKVLGDNLLTSRHEGPEIRTMAIPALPGAVDRAYMVSSPEPKDGSAPV